MTFTPTQVLDLVDRVLPVRDPARVGMEWGTRISGALEGMFVPFLAGGGDVRHPERVASAIRNASSWLRTRAPTLYVSDGYLRNVADPTLEARLAPDERGSRFEHAVPLKFSLPENCFIQDPLSAIRAPEAECLLSLPWLNRVARAMIAPVCYLSRHEDVRLERLTHPDWTRPFARYCDAIILRDAPEAPMRLYETVTGRLVEDLATFTWDNHLALMSASPVFAQGLIATRDFFVDFARRRPDVMEELARRPGGARWPLPPNDLHRAGRYTAAERAELRDLLCAMAAQGPQIASGAAMELPANRERLTLTVRHPEATDAVMLRINIGPDHGKRELYFNARNMHPAGFDWIRTIADALNSTDASVRLTPQKQNGEWRSGYDIRLPSGPRGTHAIRVGTALKAIVPIMIRTYPAIAT